MPDGQDAVADLFTELVALAPCTTVCGAADAAGSTPNWTAAAIPASASNPASRARLLWFMCTPSIGPRRCAGAPSRVDAPIEGVRVLIRAHPCIYGIFAATASCQTGMTVGTIMGRRR
jgi:hypothetical protein